MRTRDWLLTRVCGLRFPPAVVVKVCTFCTLCDLCSLFSEGLKCLLCKMLPELVLLFVFNSVRIHCCLQFRRKAVLDGILNSQ
jgi:hypothetical protein